MASLGATGPAWTRGEVEAPQGEKDMGGWVAAVYTREQQRRLGVDEEGQSVSRPDQAARKAKARSRWKVAGAVAKAVVGMPMAIGIPVTHVPADGE